MKNYIFYLKEYHTAEVNIPPTDLVLSILSSQGWVISEPGSRKFSQLSHNLLPTRVYISMKLESGEKWRSNLGTLIWNVVS